MDSIPGLTADETLEYYRLDTEAMFFGLPHMSETTVLRLEELHQRVSKAYREGDAPHSSEGFV